MGHISRRNFLGQAACAAVGTSTLYSTILNLGAINTLAARPHIIGSTGDYKALVCILMSGGLDSYNVLVPTETSEYDDYVLTRNDLALDKNATPPQLLDLDYDDNGRTYAVHAGMPGVQNLFDTGELSFVANIGSLVEPIASKAEYESGTKKIPLGLYSHSDQQMHWQTSVPQSRTAVGLGGRLADMFQDMNSIPEISLNISLAGKNRFQAGQFTNELSISNTLDENNVGFAGYPWWYGMQGFLNFNKDTAIDSLATQNYASIFEKTYGDLAKGAVESNEVMKVALQKLIPLNTSFSDTRMSRDLKKVAEMISLQGELGANRQIFFIDVGGWDHHDNVIGAQAQMLPEVDNALTEFNAALHEIGMNDSVVTFTISDFARTLTSNGNGSDHAWGGNTMIMGGPVLGKQIYGAYPSLSLQSTLNLDSRGRILPTTSVDEFYAELALWFGASPNDLDYLLPNLCNFYSTAGCPAPVPTGYSPLGMFS